MKPLSVIVLDDDDVRAAHFDGRLSRVSFDGPTPVRIAVLAEIRDRIAGRCWGAKRRRKRRAA